MSVNQIAPVKRLPRTTTLVSASDIKETPTRLNNDNAPTVITTASRRHSLYASDLLQVGDSLTLNTPIPDITTNDQPLSSRSSSWSRSAQSIQGAYASSAPTVQGLPPIGSVPLTGNPRDKTSHTDTHSHTTTHTTHSRTTTTVHTHRERRASAVVPISPGCSHSSELTTHTDHSRPHPQLVQFVAPRNLLEPNEGSFSPPPTFLHCKRVCLLLSYAVCLLLCVLISMVIHASIITPVLIDTRRIEIISHTLRSPLFQAIERAEAVHSSLVIDSQRFLLDHCPSSEKQGQQDQKSCEGAALSSSRSSLSWSQQAPTPIFNQWRSSYPLTPLTAVSIQTLQQDLDQSPRINNSNSNDNPNHLKFVFVQLNKTSVESTTPTTPFSPTKPWWLYYNKEEGSRTIVYKARTLQEEFLYSSETQYTPFYLTNDADAHSIITSPIMSTLRGTDSTQQHSPSGTPINDSKHSASVSKDDNTESEQQPDDDIDVQSSKIIKSASLSHHESTAMLDINQPLHTPTWGIYEIGESFYFVLTGTVPGYQSVTVSMVLEGTHDEDLLAWKSRDYDSTRTNDGQYIFLIDRQTNTVFLPTLHKTSNTQFNKISKGVISEYAWMWDTPTQNATHIDIVSTYQPFIKLPSWFPSGITVWTTYNVIVRDINSNSKQLLVCIITSQLDDAVKHFLVSNIIYFLVICAIFMFGILICLSRIKALLDIVSALIIKMYCIEKLDLANLQFTSTRSKWPEVQHLYDAFNSAVNTLIEIKSFLPLAVQELESGGVPETFSNLAIADGSSSPAAMEDSRLSYCSQLSDGSLGESIISSSVSNRSHASKAVYASTTGPCLQLGVESRDTVLVIISIGNLHQLAETVTSSHIMDMYAVWMENVVTSAKKCRGQVDRLQADKLIINWPSRQWSLAAECACGIVKAMEAQNKSWEPEGLPRLQLSVGIVVGRVLLGNMGCVSMKAHTIVGTLLPLALHLTELNKHIGTTILTDKKMYSVSQFHFNSRPITTYAVQCTRHAHCIGTAYEMTGKKEDTDEEWMYNLPEGDNGTPYFKAWAALEKGQLPQACTHFQQHVDNSPDDSVADKLYQRIIKLKDREVIAAGSPPTAKSFTQQTLGPNLGHSSNGTPALKGRRYSNASNTPRSSPSPLLSVCGNNPSSGPTMDSPLWKLAIGLPDAGHVSSTML